MNGLLRFDRGVLWLQHQTNDSVLGVLRSRPRESALPLEQLVSIRSGWKFKWLWKFWATPLIELQLGDLELASRIPGAEGGRVKLLLRWPHRRQARALVAEVEAALAEARYHTLNADIERLARSHPRVQAASDAGAGRTGTGPSRPEIAPGQEQSE